MAAGWVYRNMVIVPVLWRENWSNSSAVISRAILRAPAEPGRFFRLDRTMLNKCYNTLGFPSEYESEYESNLTYVGILYFCSPAFVIWHWFCTRRVLFRISHPAQNLGSCAELRKIYQMAQKMRTFCWFLLTPSLTMVKITHSLLIFFPQSARLYLQHWHRLTSVY